jgi:ATP-binding cassette subfamily B (MDR/TAP) protein 1
MVWLYFLYRVFGAVLLGAVSIGRESQFAPDYGRAKTSAAQIFALLEKKPRIDNYLKNVEFSYPNRPTVKVMKGTNLTVEPGQTFALVGQTGCGKSTTIQLLERLYDPSAGQVVSLWS